MKKDDIKAGIIDLVAPLFNDIENGIIQKALIKQESIPSGLYQECKQKGRVFDDLQGVQKAINYIIRDMVISAIFNKIKAGFFNDNLIINYPYQAAVLLSDPYAAYVVMLVQVDKKPVYLLISYADWNNYYGGDEIDIGSDDLPF